MQSSLDFYQFHQISPERQDIQDLECHFQRRESLYRHLGLHPLLFQNLNILEVGPGSGYNSIYTASLQPQHYVLIEPNPAGIKDIEQLFEHFPHYSTCIDLQCVTLEDFSEQNNFDMVICEGVFTGLKNNAAFLKKLARWVKPGGILIITCADAISDLAETLRWLIAQLLLISTNCLKLQDKIDFLLPIFKPHLKTLKGMSKLPQDWIVDNLIMSNAVGELLSIDKAIQTLDKDFNIFGSSPHFINDWRWYKDLHGNKRNYNQLAIDQFWNNAHNFLDYTQQWEPRPTNQNKQLMKWCLEIRNKVLQSDFNHFNSQTIVNMLHLIKQDVQCFSNSLIQAIDEALHMISSKELTPEQVRNSVYFGKWFGRGMQYLSFTRKHNVCP